MKLAALLKLLIAALVLLIIRVSTLAFFEEGKERFPDGCMGLCNVAAAELSRSDRDALHRCAAPPKFDLPGKEQLWAAFVAATSVLNALGAPYHVESGTLLGWYRGCGLVDAVDVDLAVDRAWGRAHAAQLAAAMARAGFRAGTVFGTPAAAGFERAWHFGGTAGGGAVGSGAAAGGDGGGRGGDGGGGSGARVDIFFIDWESTDVYSWALWIEGTPNTCRGYAKGRAAATWAGARFPVPVPIDGSLAAQYGSAWRHPPRDRYQWDVTPFEAGKGSCERAASARQEEGLQQRNPLLSVNEQLREIAAARQQRVERAGDDAAPNRQQGHRREPVVVVATE